VTRAEPPRTAKKTAATILLNSRPGCFQKRERLADTIGYPSFHGVELTPYAEPIEELPPIEHGSPYYDIDSLTAEVRTKMEGVESI
jgi:hypothetical protein